MVAGTKLKPLHQPKFILDAQKARSYRIWLTCGHHAGLEPGGTTVVRKKCRECGSWRAVERVEPFDAR